MRRPLLILAALYAVIAATLAGSAEAGHRAVIVNGSPLEAHVLQALEQGYSVHIADGRYWYDRVSGLWGYEGGPNRGQILPGLPLGGPLHPNASGGRTAVVVNGRILHPVEIAFLHQRFGSVIPGRYWLDPRGNAGFEGGPPQWNLSARASGGRRSLLGHSLTGSVLSDGTTTGYIGGGVGITCGPDGGCF